MKFLQQSLAAVLVLPLAFAPSARPSAPEPQGDQSVPAANGVAAQPPEQLQQLVAPIALYPDALVSQILAGATYPSEIVEADRWLQEHPSLKGQDLADQVDRQPWDPSVKALTQFPSVLANMDKNLSWTSALGEAYVNQPNDVMDAVQAMRARAKNAGNLETNGQEKVETQGRTIVIEPAEPDVVYVPAYDPWIVYGAPVVAWPGWYAYPGLYIGGPGISFGLGLSIGFFAGFGWGWHHWGCDWGHRTVIFDHSAFISRSRTFYGGRAGFHDFGAARGYESFRGGGARREEFRGGSSHGNGFRGGGARGSAGRGQPGLHSGAFSGFDHGGVARDYSSRGRSSFGGGFHGGGGRH